MASDRVCAGAALAVLLGAFAASAGPGGNTLDSRSCAAIAQYDAREGTPSILEQFEAMALRFEWCASVRRSCASPYLRRWDDRVFLYAVTGEDLPEGAAARALAGIDAALTFIAESLGREVADFAEIAVADTPPPQAALILALGSRQELRRISGELDKRSPAIDFMASTDMGLSQKQACWAVSYDADVDPGRTVRGVVFIDAELPAETLVTCGKEETFNVFLPGDPIGDASLFDDPWGRAAADPDLGAAFSVRDEVLLQLLYHRFLTPGMPSSKALEAAARAIETDCR